MLQDDIHKLVNYFFFLSRRYLAFYKLVKGKRGVCIEMHTKKLHKNSDILTLNELKQNPTPQLL